MNEVVERRVKCEMLADRKWIVAAMGAVAVAVGVILPGCGGSSTRPTTTAGVAGRTSTASTATTSGGSSTGGEPAVTIAVTIPGLLKEDYFPSRYTCDGANISFPVRWSKVPSGTAELAMFLVKLNSPVNHPFYDWAVAGLNPNSHGVAAGQLPSGAVVGRNSFGQVGYSICPPRGSVEEHFVLRLLALPHRIAAKSGFDPGALFNEAEQSTKVVGLAGGVYTRR